MKQIIFTLFSLALLASCKKDETRAVYHEPSELLELTSSANTVTLDSSKKQQTAISFNWNKVSYGINAEITYTLQLDVAGGDFSKPQEVIIGNDTTSASFTHVAFNTLALAVGIRPNASGAMQVRVKAQVQQNGITGGPSSIPPVYADVKTVNVTTYPPPDAPLMYLSGQFNGWPTGGAPIADTGFTGAYEGYIYVGPTISDYQFKILVEKDWAKTYALDKSDNTKMIATAGGAGDNLFTAGKGYYQIKANTQTLKWEANIATWGLVGDAVSDNWTTNVPMTYDATTQVWSVTTTVKQTGQWKFWANQAWTLNYGIRNGALVLDGPSFAAPATEGAYKITLNLSNPAKYTYSIIKQ